MVDRCKCRGKHPVLPGRRTCAICTQKNERRRERHKDQCSRCRARAPEPGRRSCWKCLRKEDPGALGNAQDPVHTHTLVTATTSSSTLEGQYQPLVAQLLSEVSDLSTPLADTFEHICGGPAINWARYDSIPADLCAVDTSGTSQRTAILRTTDDELCTAIQGGYTVPPQVGIIVLAGSLRNPNIYFDNFRRTLDDSQYHAETVEYQNYDEGGPTKRNTVAQLLEDIRVRSSDLDMRRVATPKNYLSWNRLFNGVPEPLSLSLLKCDLLSVLSRRVRNSIARAHGQKPVAGKAATSRPSPRATDLDACLGFFLYGERGSISSWHLDVLNGTWATCLSGLKMWFVYTGPWTSAVQDEFMDQGTDWKPPPEHVEMILLAPGDTIIMRPGYPIVHAVVTLDDSGMAGGMIWSADALDRIMTNLEFIIPNALTTNESIPRQLTEFIDELLVLFKETDSRLDERYEDSVVSLKEVVKGQLSCPCAQNVRCTPARCPCLSVGTTRDIGCTSWCRGGVCTRLDQPCTDATP